MSKKIIDKYENIRYHTFNDHRVGNGVISNYNNIKGVYQYE